MTMRHEDIPGPLNELTERVIGCAIEVHRHLGPGLLEAAYEVAIAHELASRGVPFERQVEIDMHYKGVPLPKHRLDLVVDRALVVELKSVRGVDDVYLAQLVSYLRAGNFPLGLLINFNTPLLTKGVYRRINPLSCPSMPPSASPSAPPRSIGSPC